MTTFFVLVGIGIVIVMIIKHSENKAMVESVAKMTTDDIRGVVNNKLVCPHCQTAGHVRVKKIVGSTNLYSCDNCDSTWDNHKPLPESGQSPKSSAGIIFPIE